MSTEEITMLAAQVAQELAMYQKDMLTIDEAARYLGIAKRTLYNMMCDRAIVYYKPTVKLTFFRRADLDAWMMQNRSASAEELNDMAYRLMNQTSESRIRRIG